MIAGIALTLVGAIFCALSLLECALMFLSTGSALHKVARSLMGRQKTDVSQMEHAMEWVQVFGFLLVGGAMLLAGLSVLGA
jgi:hypothetical protein